MPISEASVERFFSLLKNIWTFKRNQLKVTTIRKMIFLNEYYSINLKWFTNFTVSSITNVYFLRNVKNVYFFIRHGRIAIRSGRIDCFLAYVTSLVVSEDIDVRDQKKRAGELIAPNRRGILLTEMAEISAIAFCYCTCGSPSFIKLRSI